MEREMIIESEEAYDLAHDLAKRLEVTPSQAVEIALRQYKAALSPLSVHESEEERAAFIARATALGAKVRAELGERATSDHDDLYDRDGLPR